MEQTQSPKMDREYQRFESAKNTFLDKSIEDQSLLIHEFIGHLKIKYHQTFFKRLGPTGILNERWFLQFLTDKFGE